MLRIFKEPSSNEIMEGILDLTDDLKRAEGIQYLKIVSDGENGYYLTYSDDGKETKVASKK